MTRTIAGAVTTASAQEVVRPVILVDLDFSSGHVYAHSGVGTIVWNSNSYLGVGNLGEISAIEENTELQASGIVVSLSGLDSDNIAVALGEHYQGRSGIVYLGLLDVNHQLVGDPVKLFQGRMDTQKIKLGKQGLINLSVENPLADWQRPRNRRFNNDDQQAKYPGDKGLEFVEQSVNKEIYWGI